MTHTRTQTARWPDIAKQSTQSKQSTVQSPEVTPPSACLPLRLHTYSAVPCPTEHHNRRSWSTCAISLDRSCPCPHPGDAGVPDVVHVEVQLLERALDGQQARQGGGARLRQPVVAQVQHADVAGPGLQGCVRQNVWRQCTAATGAVHHWLRDYRVQQADVADTGLQGVTGRGVSVRRWRLKCTVASRGTAR